MANYKDIHGTQIEVVSSDPSNPVNGQVWYNTTASALKGFTSNPTGAWASGTAVNAGRGGMGYGNQGTTTSQIVYG